MYDEYEDEDEEDEDKKPCIQDYRVENKFEDTASYNSDTELPSSLSEYVTSETDNKPSVNTIFLFKGIESLPQTQIF